MDVLQSPQFRGPSEVPATSPESFQLSRNQLDALLTFIYYQCHTRPRVDVAQGVLSFMNQHAKRTSYEARAEGNMGDPIIFDLVAWGKWGPALQTLMVRRDVFIAHDRPWDPRGCLLCIISVYLADGRVEEPRASFNEALELTEREVLPNTGGLHEGLKRLEPRVRRNSGYCAHIVPKSMTSIQCAF